MTDTDIIRQHMKREIARLAIVQEENHVSDYDDANILHGLLVGCCLAGIGLSVGVNILALWVTVPLIGLTAGLILSRQARKRRYWKARKAQAELRAELEELRCR